MHICVFSKLKMCFNYRLDTKQPPYRILFRRAGGASFLQVAVAETEKKTEVAWSWLECK